MDRVEYEKLIIQDLSNLYKNDELALNPWYQRRSVWTRPQKAYLINTLFEQKPIPTLYVRHSIDIETEKSVREVVDGQQRIRAILDYLEGDFVALHPRYEKKIKYKDLKKTDAEKFRLTSLSVGYLLGATDEDVIEIFGRLNSVSKTLNPQEKRNARFSGEYKQFCLREAASRVEMWRDLGVFSANDIARMTEVQFISDLVLNLLKGLSDFHNSKLNKIYEKYDEEFPHRDRIEYRLDRIFSQIAKMHEGAIRDTIFSRQPIFFSLCLALDSGKKKLSTQKLEDSIFRIDRAFNSDVPLNKRSKADIDFHAACTSSTQRIKSREVRDTYIKRAIGVK